MENELQRKRLEEQLGPRTPLRLGRRDLNPPPPLSSRSPKQVDAPLESGLSVAVDDAERDDDGHAEEDGDGEHEPAVLELARHDTAQEDRSRPVTIVVVVVATASTPPAAASSATGAPCPSAAAATDPSSRRYDRRPLDGRHRAVETTDLTRQKQPAINRQSHLYSPCHSPCAASPARKPTGDA